MLTVRDGRRAPDPAAAPLFALFAAEFTAPTAARAHTLLTAALPTTGRRTVAGVLRTVRHLAPGHATAYRRVLSWADWSGLAPGCAQARLVVVGRPADAPVVLAGGDTMDGRTGRTDHGKARHRAPVRSSHAFTAWRYGHTWVVLAVLVRFPFAARSWPLPVIVDLDLSEADGLARGRAWPAWRGTGERPGWVRTSPGRWAWRRDWG